MDNAKIPYCITGEEMALAQSCLDLSLKCGASGVRVTLNKSCMDLFMLLNGELDKVTHSGDRSMILSLFVNGKYGTFSTNKLSESDLQDFIPKAVEAAGMVDTDEFRKLPDPSRTEKDAITGLELGLYDETYAEMTPQMRMKLATEASCFSTPEHEDYKFISEEIEYSDSVYDTYIIDSNGLKCRHIESSFEIGCESEIQDPKGNKYTGYGWDSATSLSALRHREVCSKALQRALSQIGPRSHRSGNFKMVVENEVASKLVTPIMDALRGGSIQQNNSFLRESLGKRVFPPLFTIWDNARVPGAFGTKLFDAEGLATKNTPVIEDGVVKEYFISTYMAGKLGMEPTIGDVTRPCILPFLRRKDGETLPESFGKTEILRLCGNGILVTGFNGGNKNAATGDFSYGIEGFAFKNGKISHPLRGMVVTGNFLTLWQNLIAAGTDFRSGMSAQIPTLAFDNVAFSG